MCGLTRSVFAVLNKVKINVILSIEDMESVLILYSKVSNVSYNLGHNILEH